MKKTSVVLAALAVTVIGISLTAPGGHGPSAADIQARSDAQGMAALSHQPDGDYRHQGYGVYAGPITTPAGEPKAYGDEYYIVIFKASKYLDSQHPVISHVPVAIARYKKFTGLNVTGNWIRFKMDPRSHGPRLSDNVTLEYGDEYAGKQRDYTPYVVRD